MRRYSKKEKRECSAGVKPIPCSILPLRNAGTSTKRAWLGCFHLCIEIIQRMGAKWCLQASRRIQTAHITRILMLLKE